MKLSEALDRALVRRLYPESPLGPKHIAHALGIDPATLWRYRTGRLVIPGDTLMALIGFWRARGDFGFEAEIMAVSREKEVVPYRPEQVSEHHNATPRLSLVVAGAARPWRVERLPLDGLRHPTAQRLASLASSESDLLVAADNAGLLRQCAIFRVYGSEVMNLQIGGSAGMRPSIRNAMMGLPLDRWPDRPYARVIRDHVLSAREGPSYHRLEGTVHGIKTAYKRSLFPAGEFSVSFTELEAA